MMKNNELYKEESCCGCGACVVKCPQNAISLKENKYGFVYPQIEESICVNCGACKKVCVFLKEKKINKFDCYASVNMDDSLIMKSASGGVFSAIAYDFIKAGGYVCGAATIIKQGIMSVEHIVINNTENLYLLQGSKYVQSSTVSAYKKIQTLLKNGKKVLFSGTPCQVDAIKSLCDQYVGKGLFTIDIICHGVPSQKFFNEYLLEYQKQKKSLINHVDFRNKRYGWGLKGIIQFENGESESITPETSSYYRLFLDGEIYRENCYNCSYSSLNRVGDITIGDYWGVEKFNYELFEEKNISEDKGISCVIVNNDLGNELIEKYGDKLFMRSVDINNVMVNNTQLREPAKHTSKRNKVLKTFANQGYKPIEKEFVRKNRIKKCHKFVKNMIPKRLKKFIKKIIRKDRSYYL